MSREKTRPTTRRNRNQTKVVRVAPTRRTRPPYENCTTRSPAPLNASHRTSSTIEGGRGCNIFVPILGGNGTKIAPTGEIFDGPPGEMP